MIVQRRFVKDQISSFSRCSEKIQKYCCEWHGNPYPWRHFTYFSIEPKHYRSKVYNMLIYVYTRPCVRHRNILIDKFNIVIETWGRHVLVAWTCAHPPVKFRLIAETFNPLHTLCIWAWSKAFFFQHTRRVFPILGFVAPHCFMQTCVCIVLLGPRPLVIHSTYGMLNNSYFNTMPPCSISSQC